MRARLDDMDARGLELRFGDTARVVLGQMENLRGDLISESAITEIERAGVTRAEVATLDLRFGTTLISSDAAILFDELRGRFRNGPTEPVRCELQAARVDCVRIQLTFGLSSGKLVISGRAVLTDARLTIDDTCGVVFAENLALTEVVLELAGTKLDVETLEGIHVTIEWSPTGVRVRATSAAFGAASAATAISARTASEAELSSAPLPVVSQPPVSESAATDPGPAGLAAIDPALAAAELAASEPAAAALAASKLAAIEPAAAEPAAAEPAATEPAATEPIAAQPSAAQTGSLLPLAVQKLIPLLDGLSGQLDVDLGLDLTVPVLGHRRATHKFRIPIENGALDYRKLESDLSTLEDLLLDFSMRDDVLVLELGIPLLPTRGMGKPLLRWHVEGEDVALAHQHWIRLAMLPQFHTIGDDTGDGGDSDGSGKSPVTLNELSLLNLHGNLRLEHAAPPAALPLRRIGELVVRADVHHGVETPSRDGIAAAQIAGMELGPMNIAVGSMAFGFRAVTVVAADVDAELAGFQLRAVRAKFRGLQIADLDVGPRALEHS